MNAAGIDVFKGKSTVAVMRPFGEVAVKPFEVRHNAGELRKLADFLKSMDGEVRFQVMQVLIQISPSDDAVYRFLDRKRFGGKKYHVYMVAGCNKFLQIYYARVNEYLASRGSAV